MKDFLFQIGPSFCNFCFILRPCGQTTPKPPSLSRRGSDSDVSVCVDGARVSVQETKPVTFRDLDISRGQQIALDNFVEALSGHVNAIIYYLAAHILAAKLQAANSIPRLLQ